MSARLGEILASVDESKYEAILLGYGLCSNGLVGLTARSIPLVIPVHDCITLFLGSKEQYSITSTRVPACNLRRAAGSRAAKD